MSEVKICFGIVSYFPKEQPARKQRQDRLDRLVKQLSNYWPEVPILVVAQDWGHYTLDKKCVNPVYCYHYSKLGILVARQTLRQHFLESQYNYIVMFDDDAIIQIDDAAAPQDYIKEIKNHPNGFCFIKGNGASPYTPYCDSQLNLCAISKWIYEQDPIPNSDPEKSQAFEDRLWSTLLHYKYADYEFDAPNTIRCIHFKNPNEVAPSTWSHTQKRDWKAMRANTRLIENYISKYKDFPDVELLLGHKADIDGNNYIQLIGNCSDIGYLGHKRIRGPVDNILTKGIKTIEYLLDNKYLEQLKTVQPVLFDRKPSFEGDLTTGYDYDFGQIIHNNPLEDKYIQEITERIRTFNTFYNLSKEKDNFYFVCCLNMYDIDANVHQLIDTHFEDILIYLQARGILDKCIFVQTRTREIKGTANWFVYNLDDLIIKYHLKALTINDNLIRGEGIDKSHKQFLDKVKKLLHNNL